MTESSGLNGPHPDLRQIACDAVNDLLSNPQLPSSERPSTLLTPGEIVIRCQRTWNDVQTVNSVLDGGSFSACVAQFERDGELYSFFVEAALPKGAAAWHWAGSQGGRLPRERQNRAGGFMLTGGSHVCVGGLGAAPDGGSIQVELADGSTYESRAVDGCCIAFAPVTSTPQPDDHVIVRYRDANNTELQSDRVWIGDGGPPPGSRPAA